MTKHPFVLKWGIRDLYIDLGAEKLIAAEKTGQKIAVEIKSFIGASLVTDLENALGQYILYRTYASVTPNIYFMVRQISNICLFAGFMKSDAPY
ncbi:element excision factor XisH family protein [Anabaena azotica]|uniref:element excision factor XisH family protein n=1 Tax=Anabaena azotica TaxID=197653 RepID=UPI0039A7679B